jgi:hypothetical protein
MWLWIALSNVALALRSMIWQSVSLSLEHIINAGKDMEKLLLHITNEIFRQGRVPETLRARLLTPIFKNKGLKIQATNNRGIAVLPIISKIVEPIIKVNVSGTRPCLKISLVI